MLNYNESINVDAMLTKHGKYYLYKYRIKIGALGIIALALFLLPTQYAPTAPLYFKTNIFLLVLLIVAQMILIIFLLIGISKTYVTVRKLINPGYISTPHEQRLRGI